MSEEPLTAPAAVVSTEQVLDAFQHHPGRRYDQRIGEPCRKAHQRAVAMRDQPTIQHRPPGRGRTSPRAIMAMYTLTVAEQITGHSAAALERHKPPEYALGNHGPGRWVRTSCMGHRLWLRRDGTEE